ncbi:MAG: thioredoxin domain-containing protein [Sphingomonadaceae bacterium]
MKKLVSALAMGALLLTAEAGLAAGAKRKAAAAATPLDQRVTLTARGTVVLGSSAAPVKLVEYMSYTCPHCADFNREAHDELRGGLVRSGKVSIELQPFMRNEFDLIATLLVTCGAKDKWFGNNDAVFAAQASWFAQPADPTYKQRWAALETNKPELRKVVARDLGLIKLMQGRGYTPVQLDACLANEVRAKQLMDQTDQAIADGVAGTPSFRINGKLQDVYGWEPLKPLIQDTLLPPATI